MYAYTIHLTNKKQVSTEHNYIILINDKSALYTRVYMVCINTIPSCKNYYYKKHLTISICVTGYQC